MTRQPGMAGMRFHRRICADMTGAAMAQGDGAWASAQARVDW